jgi:uncharacterized protein involved in exopolysaccharide biosynthesis
MNENGMRQDDEVPLFVLLKKLRAGWLYVLGGSVLGLVGACLTIAVLRPTYEAVAIVQVGQVGQVVHVGQLVQLGQVGQLGQLGQLGQVAQAAPQPVEPPTQAIERMRTPSFQLAVAQSLGNKAWIDDLSNSSTATTKYISLQLVRASVSSVPGAAPAWIELKSRSDSVESAKTIAEASVLELAKRQADIAKPMIDKMRVGLSITKEKLASAEKELEKLHGMVVNVGVKDDRFTQLSLITSLRVQKEAEMFSYRQAIMAYETALLPPATQPAKAIEAAFVVDKPVSPSKILFLALGLIGGLFAGVVSVFASDAWRRARAERLTRTAS